jgi:excisionase family DNA binding protein
MQEASKARNLDDKSYQIYALIDPRDNLVYYVGISIDASARFYAHLNDEGACNVQKRAWIAELRQAGISPLLKVLETIEAGSNAYAVACEQENYWIAELSRSGNPLLNVIGITRSYIPIGVRIPGFPAYNSTKARQKKEKGDKSSPQTKIRIVKEWLTVEEIANDLGISIETVRNWIRRKRLVAYRVGRDYRIKQVDYERFLEQRRTTRDSDDDEGE